ncbi:MAG TPA: OmpH family outer membrane protein, partial [Flavobacteriales bacterium]|nr:OmpH family outer membrane protein [Flavobacteriales bacterium]
IQAARAQAGPDLEKLQYELVDPLLARIDKAIGEVALAGNYAYILDTGSGAVLYAAKGDDITAQVKAKLGITP